MDAELIGRIEAQLVEESERRALPPEWPVLPDLPVERYTDAELYGLERDVLFRRTWVYAAHESELPESGSYVVFDRTGPPILIVRGHDRVVRAFYNTCRHRNAPVVNGSCGTARRLVCTFHSYLRLFGLARMNSFNDLFDRCWKRGAKFFLHGLLLLRRLAGATMLPGKYTHRRKSQGLYETKPVAS